MSARRVRFSATAEEEIIDLFDYISIDDEQAAIDLVNRIETRALALGSTPYIGVALDRQAYPSLRFPFRKLSIRPYGLYYFLTEDWVVIAHVIHDKQDARRVLTEEDGKAGEDESPL